MSNATQKKWLLIFNCQAAGLGKCLELLNSTLEVESYAAPEFAARQSELLERLPEFTRIIVEPTVEKNLKLELPEIAAIRRVPSFQFRGFHMDHVNLVTDGSQTGGPLAGNHSAICYAAFAFGLDIDQTIRLYRRGIYERLGYLNGWSQHRANFLARYRSHGLSLERYFLRWCRIPGGFSYVPSHPKIQCIRDIAEVLLADAGLGALKTEVLPHDNMANGVIFPVYPEIAVECGIAGDYNFKPPGRYRFMDLAEYVELSCAFYARCNEIVVPPAFQRTISKALALIAEMNSIKKAALRPHEELSLAQRRN